MPALWAEVEAAVTRLDKNETKSIATHERPDRKRDTVEQSVSGQVHQVVLAMLIVFK